MGPLCPAEASPGARVQVPCAPSGCAAPATCTVCGKRRKITSVCLVLARSRGGKPGPVPRNAGRERCPHPRCLWRGQWLGSGVQAAESRLNNIPFPADKQSGSRKSKSPSGAHDPANGTCRGLSGGCMSSQPHGLLGQRSFLSTQVPRPLLWLRSRPLGQGLPSQSGLRRVFLS